jgi:CRP-like cAMP-binding protein
LRVSDNWWFRIHSGLHVLLKEMTATHKIKQKGDGGDYAMYINSSEVPVIRLPSQGLNVHLSHSKENQIEDSVAAEVAAIWKGVQKLQLSQSDISNGD